MKKFIREKSCFIVSVIFGMVLVIISIYPVFAEELRMLVWEGYAPKNHLEIFKQQVKDNHGIDLNISVKYASEYEDFRNALKNRTADMITPSHNYPKDPRHKYIQGKLTLPLDLNHLSHFKDILPALQKTDYLTQDGEVYGVPFIYGPYGLAYNTNIVKEEPKTWKILWEPEYSGKYTIASDIYTPNIYITALAMGIDKSKIYQYKTVYSPEFLNKLQYLAKNAKKFYGSIETADDLQGLSLAACWGFAFSELKKRGEIWKMATPQEGTTCYIDCWMISHTLRNQPKLKQIAEEWIDYTISPDFQIEYVVRTLSSFPVNISIKEQMRPEEIEMFHLDVPNYFENHFIPWKILSKNTRKGFELLWKKAVQ